MVNVTDQPPEPGFGQHYHQRYFCECGWNTAAGSWDGTRLCVCPRCGRGKTKWESRVIRWVVTRSWRPWRSECGFWRRSQFDPSDQEER